MDDPSDDARDNNPQDEGKPPTFWQMVHSILSAALGVQSHKNRHRDFTYGKPGHFLLLGLLFTVVFVLILVGMVQLVIYFAEV